VKTISDKYLLQKEPFYGDKHQLPAYEMPIRGQDVKISKRLDAIIDKVYLGFISLKEACEEAYNISKKEGIPEAEIGGFIRALKRKGLSERSVLRYLPDELKDRSKVHSPSLSTPQSPPTKLSANEDKKTGRIMI
jgi:hypothetical protein